MRTMKGASGTADEAIEALQRLSEAFGLRREQLARSVGLTEAQWRVIEEISTEHFMPSMFARSRDCSPAAVSKIIRQLLDRGLIRVAIGANDARQREYSLSPAGRKLIRNLRARREKAVESVWADLDPAELARFADFSRDLAARLERYAALQSKEKAK